MHPIRNQRGAGKMRILAIGPHPDDIEIGCGGTLLKLAKAGHQVSLAVMTQGEAGGDPEVRLREQENVAKCYKTKRIFWMGFADTRVPVDRNAVDALDRVLKEVKPDIVFANHGSDTHQDHRKTASVVLSATRNLQNVLLYEVPTTIEFQPDVFVDISKVLQDKYKLLRLHKSQLNKANVAVHNILDCARTMAHFRGFQGRVKAAEGFKALRLRLEI